ncbi:hypothetical protein RchiOBHm_Chr4g0414551 [Rosa chinensis]|uniref:Uncharacterized protein n=2 Tax=Rosa chinensis TaxID=74649 RepID=A0A2P6QWF9_ROSCH|nr:hypothetical protein RchiOBHm_Chr4g0414551 [Rosa chinensis]
MSFHEICLLSSGPLCFLDCFFGLIPSERNVLIFKMLDFTFSLMITLPDQERPIMDTQNSVMRIYFDGVDAVDLLIFTSKQLHLDSLKTVTSPSTENFLWGIFHDKNHCRADMYDNGTTVDMEVDMAGGKMVGTVDVVVLKDSSTRCRRPDPIMKAVQQLLTIKKEEHSSYLTRLRVLDCTIKQLLAFNSEEPIMKDEHSASLEMKTVCSMQVKLEKDEDETCLKTDKKTLPCLPCLSLALKVLLAQLIKW